MHVEHNLLKEPVSSLKYSLVIDFRMGSTCLHARIEVSLVGEKVDHKQISGIFLIFLQHQIYNSAIDAIVVIKSACSHQFLQQFDLLGINN